MILIDGKKAAAELRQELKEEVSELKKKYNQVPGLTVILIGDLTPSQIYVRNKEKSAIEVGLKSDVIRYPDSVEEKTVLEKIDELNKDNSVSGILVQLPLPKEINEQMKIAAAKAMLDELTADFDESDIDMMTKPQKRFGNSIFNLMQSSFMPINEPNFDGEYVLDFGDVLEIQLVGQKSDSHILPVKRDGSVSIPGVGKMFVSGLSLDNAVNTISKKIESFSDSITKLDLQILDIESNN